MDKLWGMEVFVRVIECGSFSRAAESLNLANATVTSCIRNLENHLGVTLIHRNTRHLHLTEEGKHFLPKCRDILEAVNQIESEVREQANDISGTLRIESPFAIGQSLICPALIDFSQRHPDISASVTLTNKPHRLIESGTDIAIRVDKVEDAELVGRPIYKAHYVVCCAPELVKRVKPAHPGALDPAHCLGLFEEGRLTPNPWTFSKGDEHVTIQPTGPLQFNNTQALVLAAQSGAGYIHILDIFVADLVQQGALVELFNDWETSARVFHVVTIKNRFMAPKIRAFIDFLLDAFDKRRRPGITTTIDVRPAHKRKKSH